MLWCKSTFGLRYGSDCCRIFATQQQLFDFIDTTSKEGENMEATEMWLPFGIEFPSEKEVAHELATRVLRAKDAAPLITVSNTESGGGDDCGRLFRKRSVSTETSRTGSNCGVTAACMTDTKCGHRRCGVVRENYTLLYGATTLSLQTRMFLATTLTGAARVVREVEPLQQHLYEVIREGAPCHMYLDVEREKDYTAWRPIVRVVDSEDDDNNNNNGDTNDDNCSGEMYECLNVKEYTTALASAVWRPPRCCAWNCQLRADNSETTSVLLAELRTFLNTTYPTLMRRPTGALNDTSNDIGTSPFVIGDGIDVIVMRSVPFEDSDEKERVKKDNGEMKNKCEKFSQHYIIKFDDVWFKSNADVGQLVGQFVDFLYARAALQPRVHVALFYHDTPKEFAVLPPSHSTRTLPFLPLRCIIDTAVYSRNRMLRCLWSCKLHKKNVLQIEHKAGSSRMTTLTDKVALFFESLVSLPVGNRKEIFIKAIPTGASGLMSLRDSNPAGDGVALGVCIAKDCNITDYNNATKLLTDTDRERYRGLAEYLTHEWGVIGGGGSCRVSSIRQRDERFLLFHIEGSRYCGNVRRQHMSNNIYLTVDLHHGVWAQKCFDPDCVSYKSASRKIPDGLLPRDRHDWTRETQTAALALHASLRTMFQQSS